MTARRTSLLLHALAEAPDGLSTPELARRCAEDVHPWQQALTRSGNTLRRQEQAGRVRRAGVVPGAWQQGPSVIWQITDEGAMYVFERMLDRLRSARTASEFEQCRADREVLFGLIESLLEASQLPSAARA